MNEKEVMEMQFKIEDLSMKIQKLEELNFKMWQMLQEQCNYTEQLEKSIGIYGK